MTSARQLPPLTKRAAHTAIVTAGQLTHHARMLPGFLIVGAQRCGTTSLYRALSQHPAVLKAPLHKGIHYFDTSYHRGMAWYQAHFPFRWQAARAERATGAAPLTFESSPYYMFHPLAAERIARDLPGVKLIVMLRDPVERAYSAHAHEMARGFEREPFERALALEPERLAGEAGRIAADPRYVSVSHQHHAYLARGQYIDQLLRLAEIFGRASLHVVDSADFFTDPAVSYREILQFLGLPERGNPVFERHNARPRPPLPGALRQDLAAHFRPYDERLSNWLGREPSWCR